MCRNKFFILLFLSCIFLCSCSISKRIAKSAKTFINDSSLVNAHTGISIYDAGSGKYLFNYQGDKYFVPASNTKIPTCYAAMKYLGDSLVGLRYNVTPQYVQIYPTGDPTLLHKDFSRQKVWEFMTRIPPKAFFYCDRQWQAEKYGSGWSWDDYAEAYMVERSPLPIYGNVFTIEYNYHDSLVVIPDFENVADQIPIHFITDSGTSIINSRLKSQLPEKFRISRYESYNVLEIRNSRTKFIRKQVPINYTRFFNPSYLIQKIENTSNISCDIIAPYNLEFQKNLSKIYSQPTDSLLKPMMHRSDNFFAEQTLLMVSNEMLGVMNDKKIIDTLLKTDFKDLPQKPTWADGSGLSRYNLFTPQDFVFILNKMKDEFGMDRIQTIFPTGNTGTLEGRYRNESSYIFAKTGTLSGVVSLSGFLYTKKNMLLIFSVLVNNHNGSATEVRNAIERFISGLRKKY